MQLTYRGQAYTPSNTTESVNPQVAFTYRGQSYHRSASVSVTPKTNLVYRGVPYITSKSSTLDNITPVFS